MFFLLFLINFFFFFFHFITLNSETIIKNSNLGGLSISFSHFFHHSLSKSNSNLIVFWTGIELLIFGSLEQEIATTQYILLHIYYIALNTNQEPLASSAR